MYCRNLFNLPRSLIVEQSSATLGWCSAAFSSSSSTQHKEIKRPRNPNPDPDLDPDLRREILHASLKKLHIDPIPIQNANFNQISDPITYGYDQQIGKPAIRAYRAFINPKQIPRANSKYFKNLNALADQCARQIEFLQRQHSAQSSDWIRNSDRHKSATTSQTRKQFPITIVLDNIRSVFNVGSIFRSADATGCLEIITTGITAHPHGNGNEKLNKSALGAQHVVHHRHFHSTLQAIQALKSSPPSPSSSLSPPPPTLIALETCSHSVPYTRLDYSRMEHIVILLGNEVSGVHPDVLLHHVDHVVEIPMCGVKNSLNVAACAPVVLYEILRQRNSCRLEVAP